MTLNLSNPEGNYLGPNDDEGIPFEQMSNFAENNDDRCPVALVVDVSGSMQGDIGMLNAAIEKFRRTVLADPVATRRVEVALVAFNHQTEVRREFCSIDEFNPGPLTAGGGTKMCEAVNRALDMIEDRKATYRDNGVGYFRPWMVILTDGMMGDAHEVPATARRVRETEKAKGVTAFAILNGAAKYDGTRAQMRQVTDRIQPMKTAAYDELLEWLANSMEAVANSTPGDKMKLEDPSAWLEVQT